MKNRAIIAAILSCILITSFASCGGDAAESATESTAETTTQTAAQTQGSKETETKTEMGAPEQTEETKSPSALGDLEKLPETAAELLYEGKVSTSEYKLLLKLVYEDAGQTYDWVEFYNACIDGRIELSNEGVKDYVTNAVNQFGKAQMEDMKSKAEFILKAVEEAAK